MNEKPQSIWKDILKKSWNEPRRFFFWLALLSPFVFAVVVLMTGTSGNDVPPLIHWVALGAIISFILGVLGFVLAWIPPLRPLFTKLLQNKLLTIAVIVTLVGLFYAVENWRGRSAWNNFRREWESKGVRFDLESIIPPAVPDDQNFFATPPWEFLRFTKSNNAVVWKYPEGRDKSMLDCDGPQGSQAPDFGSLITAKRIDLQAWQDFYRGSNNPLAAAGQMFTNNFLIAASPQKPAKDILLALTKSDTVLKQLREAAHRPHARFWINYEDGFSALLPHLAKIKGNAQYLRLRATALLADGQADAALEDVILAFRINETIRGEATLISQLVCIAGFHINLLPIWDGLADHRWSDTQLAALEGELAKVDLLAGYQTGMSGERVLSMWTVDFVQRTRDLDAIGGLPESGNGSFGDQLEKAMGKIIFRLAPSGWFDQNKLSLGRMHVEFIRPMVDQEKRIVAPEQSRRTSTAVEVGAKPTPYNLFTGMLLHALDKAAKKPAIAQSYANLAQIACALERHRLAHGNYPETLDSLVPQFITKLPHDIINGQPLKYRRTDDGRFLLYSVGWNETDDGGTVAMKPGKTPNVDQDKGDWVWRYPQP